MTEQLKEALHREITLLEDFQEKLKKASLIYNKSTGRWEFDGLSDSEGMPFPSAESRRRFIREWIEEISLIIVKRNTL